MFYFLFLSIISISLHTLNAQQYLLTPQGKMGREIVLADKSTFTCFKPDSLALISAIENKDIAGVQQALANKADPNTDISVVVTLHGNLMELYSDRPLFMAITQRSAAIVEELCKAGADVTKYRQNKSVFYLAMESSLPLNPDLELREMLWYLLSYGAFPTTGFQTVYDDFIVTKQILEMHTLLESIRRAIAEPVLHEDQQFPAAVAILVGQYVQQTDEEREREAKLAQAQESHVLSDQEFADLRAKTLRTAAEANAELALLRQREEAARTAEEKER